VLVTHALAVRALPLQQKRCDQYIRIAAHIGEQGAEHGGVEFPLNALPVLVLVELNVLAVFQLRHHPAADAARNGQPTIVELPDDFGAALGAHEARVDADEVGFGHGRPRSCSW